MSGVGFRLGDLFATGCETGTRAEVGVVVYKLKDATHLDGQWLDPGDLRGLGTENLTKTSGSSLNGTYRVGPGVKADEEFYGGTVTIKPNGEVYELEWELARSGGGWQATRTGVGIREGDCLVAAFRPNAPAQARVTVGSYRVKGRMLSGRWATLGVNSLGAEKLTQDLSGIWIVHNLTDDWLASLKLTTGARDSAQVTGEDRHPWTGTIQKDTLVLARTMTTVEEMDGMDPDPPIDIKEKALSRKPELKYRLKIDSVLRMKGECFMPYIEWDPKTWDLLSYTPDSKTEVEWERMQLPPLEMLNGSWLVRNNDSPTTVPLDLTINASDGRATAKGQNPWTGAIRNGELQLVRPITSVEQMGKMDPDPPVEVKRVILERKPKCKYRLVVISPTRLEGQFYTPSFEWDAESKCLTKYRPASKARSEWEKTETVPPTAK